MEISGEDKGYEEKSKLESTQGSWLGFVKGGKLCTFNFFIWFQPNRISLSNHDWERFIGHSQEVGFAKVRVVSAPFIALANLYCLFNECWLLIMILRMWDIARMEVIFIISGRRLVIILRKNHAYNRNTNWYCWFPSNYFVDSICSRFLYK